jgi:meso-butanediol dehydrogenase / (S,S)-butanediol dehydrogenase / diacetyl reductase
MSRFENKTVFVTGAASGIGRACAERFAAEGARLFLCDINPQGLESLAGELGLAAARCQVQAFDVTDPEACRAAVAQAVSHFGTLDVLCNIAGIVKPGHLAGITPEEWQQVIAVNLNSVFYLSQAAMPHLIESGGNIVNMASSAGVVGQAYNASYCASKAGVVMLSKSMAVEFSRQGVRVNAICPGGVKTPLTEGFNVPADADFSLLERLNSLLPLAMTEPADIAKLVLYVASEDARFMTGAAVSIDGGQTAG